MDWQRSAAFVAAFVLFYQPNAQFARPGGEPKYVKQSANLMITHDYHHCIAFVGAPCAVLARKRRTPTRGPARGPTRNPARGAGLGKGVKARGAGMHPSRDAAGGPAMDAQD
eukprot:4179595-Pyramimonas_sp.AAC.1